MEHVRVSCFDSLVSCQKNFKGWQLKRGETKLSQIKEQRLLFVSASRVQTRPLPTAQPQNTETRVPQTHHISRD